MRTVNPELHARRRSEILAAAERCFLLRGFHQSSMHNIAETSGLSMGLLYRYFANKEAIIEAVAQQDQEVTLQAIAGLPDGGDATNAWINLICKLARDASAPDYVALATEIVAEASRSEKLRSILRRNDDALIQAISQKLGAQQQSGAITVSQPIAEAAHSMMIIFDGLTMRCVLRTAQRTATHKELVTRLVRAALS